VRAGGGLGDVLKLGDPGNRAYTVNAVYVILFWMVVIIICLNIVFGIIIDSFASLRQEKMDREEDMRSKCFVCDLDRPVLDRQGNGFDVHIEQEHNIWNYVSTWVCLFAFVLVSAP
jgi:hypothetical protein